MRSFAWLIMLAGCGRIGFDASNDGSITVDTNDAAGLTLVTVDPGSLPPFTLVERVAELSSIAEDDDPCLSRDQLEVFFDSTRDGNDDVFTSRRASTSEPWPAPVSLAVVNSANSEEHPSLTADGLTLYFTSDRSGDPDLWFSTRADRSSPFGAPAQVAIVNTPNSERMGSLDALDQSLFLSSTRNTTNDQLFEARRSAPSQVWSTPVLVAEVATPAGDPSVHVDDRGLAMYLVQGAADPDLYWTTRTMAGSPWAATVPVAELNTVGAAESDPWLSPDLRVIYFVRSSGVGTKDIYTATR